MYATVLLCALTNLRSQQRQQASTMKTLKQVSPHALRVHQETVAMHGSPRTRAKNIARQQGSVKESIIPASSTDGRNIVAVSRRPTARPGNSAPSNRNNTGTTPPAFMQASGGTTRKATVYTPRKAPTTTPYATPSSGTSRQKQGLVVYGNPNSQRSPSQPLGGLQTVGEDAGSGRDRLDSTTSSLGCVYLLDMYWRSPCFHRPCHTKAAISSYVPYTL